MQSMSQQSNELGIHISNLASKSSYEQMAIDCGKTIESPQVDAYNKHSQEEKEMVRVRLNPVAGTGINLN